jgi:thiamine-monophosphate kinase
MVKRGGARTGDHVFVTGTIGDAALGLRVRRDAAVAKAWKLDAAMADHLVARYRLPQPRNALAEAVRAHASAAIDVSDGLVADLAKLCRVSGVSAEVEAARMPLSPAAARALGAEPALIEPILTGGEDYEILCAVPPSAAERFRAAAEGAGVPVARIGQITVSDAPPRVLDAAGRPLSFVQAGYSHF